MIVVTKAMCLLICLICIGQAIKEGNTNFDRILYIVTCMLFMIISIVIGVDK